MKYNYDVTVVRILSIWINKVCLNPSSLYSNQVSRQSYKSVHKSFYTKFLHEIKFYELARGHYEHSNNPNCVRSYRFMDILLIRINPYYDMNEISAKNY